ncbi:carbohydrate ABC transporter substrate-binding protein (CUT1 family) [Hydrogenispora ethanolica]|uniref:Carbohydrate ABC transporter substrate-binding protein (CUT1 family) n=1 Tax=Hydrogenispora ethanolica TaxID=1082276 RepID=A0A4R1R8A8_HYDET|nr:sugar ABC transporter substrate-binding protein [Hydrogenispora ethanolica]TCL61779.1 carbohydrate ABC transporter substrate-binding protein (CUT1 family) [Hydrogenispora ethanolica]
MKKLRFTLILLSLTFCLIGAATAGLAASKPVNLKMVIWGAPKHIDMYNKLLESYKKTHPHIAVEIIIAPYGEFTEKVTSMIASGNPPDITWWSEDSLTYFADKGYFVALDGAVKKWGKDWQMADFYPSTLEGGRWKGKLYAIPFSTPAPVLFYNKKLFDEAKLKYPNENWTWDDFDSALRKLSKGEGANKVYGVENLLDKGTEWQSLLNLIRAYGGNFMNAKRTRCVINSPQSVTALKKYMEWVNGGLSTKPGIAAPFEQGRSAMFLGFMSMNARFDGVKGLDYDITYVPKGPAGRKLRGGSAFLVVMKSTAYQKESLDLLRFLSSEEGIRVQSEYFGPPRRSIGLSKEFLNPATPPANKKVFIDSLQYSSLTEHFPLFVKANLIAQEEFDLMVAGKQPVEETLQKIQTRVNALLAGK